MFAINEIEVQLDSNGRAQFHMDLPAKETASGGQALVVVERLQSRDSVSPDSDAPTVAFVENVRSANFSRLPDFAVFAGEVAEAWQGVRVGIEGFAGQRFRIFVGWARRNVTEARANLPCTICRKALKGVIRAALAAMGVPTPGETIGTVADQLVEGINLDGIAAFLRELFGDWIIDRLAELLDRLLGVIRAIDDLCLELCSQLGYCP